MFLHNYIYRLKCIVKDKQTMFWAFLFPILLATLFNLAFSNLSNAEMFTEIKLGIVKSEEYEKNLGFINAVAAVSESDKGTGSVKLFDVSYTTREEADKLLEGNKIEGYIYFDSGIKLAVNKPGIKQTVIKSFIDDYMQTLSTIETIKSSSPAADYNKLISGIFQRNDYLKASAAGKPAPDTAVIYFYSLIALACLYGSFLGLKEVTAIQANLSPQGARVNMVPAHKLKLFVGSMFAAVTVQLAEILVLMCYLIYALKVDFGDQMGYIALTCIVGTITGVSLGTCIAAIIKKGEGVKIAVLIGFTMLMSFFSGTMYHGIKYIVSTRFPVLAYLNPANLITDSLYALYYYEGYSQFFTNIVVLSVFAVIFSTITYFVLRRQKYASL
ncbi:MAG: ABC transporter permease [Bacillota bacterium]